MMNKTVLLVVLQLFVVNLLIAQKSLNESLGGIQTHFQIFSDSVDLKVSNQIIILKAEKKHDQYADSFSGWGWGYGYQSFHLEFETNEEIEVKPLHYEGIRKPESRFDLLFTDAENKVISSATIPVDYVDLLSNPKKEGDPYFYSIDLIDIPVVLLDKTSKINLVKRVPSR